MVVMTIGGDNYPFVPVWSRLFPLSHNSLFLLTPVQCNLEVTENPACLNDPPPLPMSKSAGPTDISPELDIMIFRDAAHDMGHLRPRNSYSRFGAVSARLSTNFGSNSTGWIGYTPRNRTILSRHFGACPRNIFPAPRADPGKFKVVKLRYFSPTKHHPR